MVLRRETRTQPPHGREREIARRQQIEDHGKAPAGASGVDPVAGRVFRKSQGASAIAEERSVTFSGLERRPRIEHGQVGDQLGRSLALPAGERSDAGEKIVIRETRRESEHVRVHSSCVSRRFSGLG